MGRVAYEDNTSMSRRFLTWCAEAWSAAAEAEEIAMLDEDTIQQISKDCAIAPDDLLQLVKAGPHAADEMIEMMRALNLDQSDVAVLHPALYREMQLTCTKCQSKSRCRYDLQERVAGQEFSDYCGNASSLNAMRADPDLLIG
ncbi:DUF6455 family protein [Neorhizobium sp. NCHU2750]|uniref:DUF6455 family protein n=1 Tax=Neorhizobium sp. NCHU2750 TaxID=1825976 RepID=UPI000E73676B|nr:hypothetical protein NCHU2750_11320 [Neorhizobium sp. NCHU2750]